MLLYMRTTKLSYGLLAIFSYQFCGLALDSNTIPYNLSRYLLTIFKEMQGISRYLEIAMKKTSQVSASVLFPQRIMPEPRKMGIIWVRPILWINKIPSGYVKIAIENCPFIVDLPIEDGDFQ